MCVTAARSRTLQDHRVRRNFLPARLTGRPVVAGAAAIGVVAGVLIGWPGLDTVNGCGVAVNRYPSETAKDWVRYADVVVVGRAVEERESGREELEAGTYRYELERTVQLEVQDKPFTSTTRSHPTVGSTLDYIGLGWNVLRSDGRTRIPELTGDAPRVVPGHTYVLALRWEDKRWVSLGRARWCRSTDRPSGTGSGAARSWTPTASPRASGRAARATTASRRPSSGKD